jgi:hypothetical protein
VEAARLFSVGAATTATLEVTGTERRLRDSGDLRKQPSALKRNPGRGNQYFSYIQSKLTATRISEESQIEIPRRFSVWGSSCIAHSWDWPIVSRLAHATTNPVNRVGVAERAVKKKRRRGSYGKSFLLSDGFGL